MELREPAQQPFAFGQKTNLHHSAVALGVHLANQSATRSALHQPHYGVVPFLQKLGQFADRCPASSGVAGYAQQQLVLLRGEAPRARRTFTESQEFPKSITKFRKVVQAWQAVRFTWP